MRSSRRGGRGRAMLLAASGQRPREVIDLASPVVFVAVGLLVLLRSIVGSSSA